MVLATEVDGIHIIILVSVVLLLLLAVIARLPRA